MFYLRPHGLSQSGKIYIRTGLGLHIPGPFPMYAARRRGYEWMAAAFHSARLTRPCGLRRVTGSRDTDSDHGIRV